MVPLRPESRAASPPNPDPRCLMLSLALATSLLTAPAQADDLSEAQTSYIGAQMLEGDTVKCLKKRIVEMDRQIGVSLGTVAETAGTTRSA